MVESNKKSNRRGDKIWDRLFKTMLIECPALFVALVNVVFQKHYGRDAVITNLNGEAYGRDKSRTISDTAFMINGITYHFECQYNDDGTMAFRVFEYSFHIGLADARRTKNFAEFNFPNSCVFYFVPKEEMPQELSMKINFPDGSYDYKVPTIRLYDYDLDKIEREGLYIFLPYEILRHLRRVTTKKNIQRYENEITGVYGRMIEILKNAHNEDKITEEELLTLAEFIQQTAYYELETYPTIKEAVSRMVKDTIELKWKVRLKEAVEEQVQQKTLELTQQLTQQVTQEVTQQVTQEVTQQVTQEVTQQVTQEVTQEVTEDVTARMLAAMKKAGASEQLIKDTAREGMVPEGILDKVLGDL